MWPVDRLDLKERQCGLGLLCPVLHVPVSPIKRPHLLSWGEVNADLHNKITRSLPNIAEMEEDGGVW